MEHWKTYHENKIRISVEEKEDAQRYKDEIALKALFDEKGMCIKAKRDYFDEDGELIDWVLINNTYMNYPVKSDIVRMHYAEEYATETRGMLLKSSTKQAPGGEK